MEPVRPKIRVYTDMVGDLFHWGHVAFLERARQLGTELWVGVHADEDVALYKRHPIMRYEERCAVIAACRYVDHIVPTAPLIITDELLDLHQIDVVVHGDDFSPEVLANVYGAPARQGMLRTVPYSQGISTSDIIARLRDHDAAAPLQPSGVNPMLDALRSARHTPVTVRS